MRITIRIIVTVRAKTSLVHTSKFATSVALTGKGLPAELKFATDVSTLGITLLLLKI